MKNIVEAKVFKNGGSCAIRVPASFGLEPGAVVYIELNDDASDFVVHRNKPTRLAKFFERQSRLGPIADEDWNFERNQTLSPMRQSIKELIDSE